MAQQDDLKAELAALATDLDNEIEKLDEALAAKAADTGIDLSSEITTVRNMRAKLGDMASVVAPAPTGADGSDPATPAAPADGTGASS